jgi:zinc protease
MRQRSRSGQAVVLVLASVAASLAIAAASTISLTTGAAQARRADSTISYDVNGVQVIHRMQSANNVVAANLYFLGGNRQHTAANAGLEPMLLQVTAYGTRTSTREQLTRRLARIGTSVEVGADVDWSVMGIRATTATFDSTWAVFAERVMSPRIDSPAVEIVRAQLLSGARSLRDNPDALLEYLADSIAYAGHPYALSPTGTERSLSAITRAQLQAYHQDQFVKSRLLLVVVGNVERATVERLVRGTLGNLPAGNYRWTLPEPVAPLGKDVVFVQRSLPTNYILGYFQGPAANTEEYVALRLAMAILSGQLFSEIRSRRNLTYAVDAPFVERALATGGIYVTTVSPDVTLSLIRDELDALQTGTIERAGLTKLVQQFLTEYFLDNETNAAQASFLARAHLHAGDYRKAESFVEELRAVRPGDVREMANRYIRNLRFAYIGDSTKVSRGLLGRF